MRDETAVRKQIPCSLCVSIDEKMILVKHKCSNRVIALHGHQREEELPKCSPTNAAFHSE